jgi:hypothetical protein
LLSLARLPKRVELGGCGLALSDFRCDDPAYLELAQAPAAGLGLSKATDCTGHVQARSTGCLRWRNDCFSVADRTEGRPDRCCRSLVP